LTGFLKFVAYSAESFSKKLDEIKNNLIYATIVQVNTIIHGGFLWGNCDVVEAGRLHWNGHSFF
jgi:hypothetical protein